MRIINLFILGVLKSGTLVEIYQVLLKLVSCQQKRGNREERGEERESERDREIQTDRQTDKQRERERDL